MVELNLVDNSKVIVSKKEPDRIEESKEEQSGSQIHPKFKHLNAASVLAMQQMGIPDDKILSSLTYIRRKLNYTSVGEVDKALSLLKQMQEHSTRQESELENVGKRENELIAAIARSKNETVKLVREKSAEVKEKNAASMQVHMVNFRKNSIYAWGDNSFNQLGFHTLQDCVMTPRLIPFK